ncbi:hypothetical protein HU727_015615 [Pseudomonas sp. SWRI153]|uniref:Uncharacterized protein n=1 Tax=Pseudomonas khorasanensis TaxID=2745508 RepID=A0A923JG91_9PSED|nr:hypothetical protein [Pseudomonas khorasanensis]MBV4487020.1 hypothetical protein [Pseudomonas khorasanensis]
MTAVQIYALIAIVLMVAGVYWLAYRHGFNSGRAEGYSGGYSEGYDVGGCVGYRDGQAIQSADSTEEIRNLQHTLDQAHDQRKKLYAHYERALAASKLGEQERLTLLEIADKLRIASETFSAFRTGKKLERDTRTLRDQALAMAALLEPAEQENAA